MAGYEEVSVDPTRKDGNAIGVFIQELTVRLEGEPPIYPATVTGFEGDGQR